MVQNNLKTIKVRTFSSVVYIIVFLLAILYKNIGLVIFCSIVNCLCWIEFQKLSALYKPILKFNSKIHNHGIIIASLGFMIFFYNHLEPNSISLVGEIGWWVFLVSTLTIPIVDILLSKKYYIYKVYFDIMGLIYITINLTFFVSIKLFDLRDYVPISFLKNWGTIFVLTMVLSIWINDSMAYLGGSIFGKTPFFPNVSPKKTWEGTLIGLTFSCMIIFMLVSIYCKEHKYLLTGIAFIASFGGTVGDLLESKFKRMAGVKDSGSIMPGHGGCLDRFDSIIFSAPFVYGYLYWAIPVN